jgi:hypothetical protein
MTVPIVNLIVTLDKGKIESLVWRNSCYDDQCCEWNNCKDTSLPTQPAGSERNCVIIGCDSSQTSCDTQVFVTWKGVDREGRDLVSDNYRLTGFTDFGVRSYVDAAQRLSDKTYD